MRIRFITLMILVTSCNTSPDKPESNKLDLQEPTPQNSSPKHQETACEIDRIVNFSEINKRNLGDTSKIDVRSCLHDENKVQIILDHYDLIKSSKIKSSLFKQLVLYMPSHDETIERYWRINGGIIRSDTKVLSPTKQSTNFDFGVVFGSSDFATFSGLSKITKKNNSNKTILHNRNEVMECHKKIKGKDFGERYFMSLPLIENGAILDSIAKDTSNFSNSKEIVFAYLSYFKYKLLFENPITVDFVSLRGELSKFKADMRIKIKKNRNSILLF